MAVYLRTRKIKDNQKRYYLDIYIDKNNRKYEWLHSTSADDTPEKRKEKKLLAQTIRSQRDIEIQAKGSVYVPAHISKANFLAFYHEYLESYNKRDYRMIQRSLAKFTDFLINKKYIKNSNDSIQINSINTALCKDFKEYLNNEAGLSGETPRNYFARFKKVIKAATEKNLFYKNPTEGIIFKGAEGARNNLKKEVLEIEELRLLKQTECGNETVKKAFLFACFTGLGISEINRLQWSYISKSGRLKINRSKTGTEIDIKLSETALSLIGERSNPNSLIFEIKISGTSVNKNLRNWTKRAGIDKHITFYCGRHSYAVLMLKQGTNLKVLADAMGQTSTNHTIKYLNHVAKEKDKATSDLPNI